MAPAYIALGSNLGDRWATIQAAVRRLRAEPGLRVIATSEVYETAPVDCPPGSGDYLNAVVAVETDRSPEDLLKLLLHIEQQFGRVRTGLNSPRTLDLDLLLYGDRVINTPELVVPHPRMHERDFVLAPLAELYGSVGRDAFHPVLKKTADELQQAFFARDADLSVPRPRLYIERRECPQTLAGLRALVTGSTSGIGATIAGEFAEHGTNVVGHGRRPRLDPGEKFVSADLRDPIQVDRLADEAWDLSGGLDILVCNAGADTLTGDAAKWSFEEKLDALLAVDLKATMRLARTIGARMKERGRGAILTVGWDQAETGMEGESGQLFGAVKGAVMCFTRSLALSLAPEVRVNCLAPGWIRTAWGETASAAWQERVRRETPLGVWGLPEDVAAAAVWLASPAAGFITGQTIRVNGGAVR
ncbi:MAG TPA: 2-amino-4-hydroxy-6-hydroxymethyldihydropteridine diphosphokinase [Gemmataceae bacterium]|nr:2-amino-4-hydroxy-6-hydroxymethyldihydropteridine diphosphokinase [Gemmataceae bacterium]